MPASAYNYHKVVGYIVYVAIIVSLGNDIISPKSGVESLGLRMVRAY